MGWEEIFKIDDEIDWLEGEGETFWESPESEWTDSKLMRVLQQDIVMYSKIIDDHRKQIGKALSPDELKKIIASLIKHLQKWQETLD